ncbi:MAG: hypothetical protein JOZ75_02415 [Candidatus Dormibacteraeota bacterium]|nr:hypothetical protein [Candidatus Dormibacteraeota bacterium]
MSDGYTRELGAELRRLGVPAARRRRLLLETEDHLRSDPGALSRFGSAADIARQCADELGTSGARRVSITAFAALAFAGLLFGVLMLAVFATVPRHTILCCATSSAPRSVAFAVLVVAPQVAFVSGVLAVVRAVRLRRRAALPRSEVNVLRRRSAVALLSGAATMAALVALVVQFASVLPGWLVPASYAAASASVLLLAAASLPLVVTSRVRVQTAGAAGDVFSDLGPVVPAPVRGHPWVFAGICALAVALVVFAPGLVADDGYDAALRGAAEAIACLAGFAVLGRFLSLRS